MSRISAGGPSSSSRSSSGGVERVEQGVRARQEVGAHLDPDLRVLGGPVPDARCDLLHGATLPVGLRAMSWEPELEELRRREELARQMGGRRAGRAPARERAAHRARADRAPVRRRQLPRDRRDRRQGHLRRRRRAGGLPAGQHGRRPGPHRRAAGGGPGRRLHRPRRRRRRGDLAEDGLRRADGARPAAAARAAGRRHGRRGQRQVARGDGLHLRAVRARLRADRGQPVARAGGRRGARARWPGWARRGSWPRTSR